MAAPAVVQYQVRENADELWHTVADYAQGEDIPYHVVGTLPADLATRAALPYWLVVEPEGTLDYADGSARVMVTHADGTTADVTDLLTVGYADGELYAGAPDIKAAVADLAATDTLTLFYTMRLNDGAHVGLARGNNSWAHLEYGGTGYADGASGAQASDALPDGATTAPSGTAQASSASTRSASADGASGARSSTVQAASTPTAAAPVSNPAAARLPLRAAARVAGPLVAAQASTALTAQATRGTGLTSSPQIQVTVYTWRLRVEKVSASTGAPLAGATFALRDEHGNYYHAASGTETDPTDDAWVADVADATLATTDARGLATFDFLDSDAYELVEVRAPEGYAVVDPVDVALSASVVDAGTTWAGATLAATSRAGEVRSVDADEGTVALVVADPAASGADDGTSSDATPSTDANTAGTDSPGRADLGSPSLRAPLSMLGGLLARTTDAARAAWPALIISVLALLCGLALRRGQGRMDTQRTSAGTELADKDERNGHGTEKD